MNNTRKGSAVILVLTIIVVVGLVVAFQAKAWPFSKLSNLAATWETLNFKEITFHVIGEGEGSLKGATITIKDTSTGKVLTPQKETDDGGMAVFPATLFKYGNSYRAEISYPHYVTQVVELSQRFSLYPVALKDFPISVLVVEKGSNPEKPIAHATVKLQTLDGNLTRTIGTDGEGYGEFIPALLGEKLEKPFDFSLTVSKEGYKTKSKVFHYTPGESIKAKAYLEKDLTLACDTNPHISTAYIGDEVDFQGRITQGQINTTDKYTWSAPGANPGSQEALGNSSDLFFTTIWSTVGKKEVTFKVTAKDGRVRGVSKCSIEIKVKPPVLPDTSGPSSVSCSVSRPEIYSGQSVTFTAYPANIEGKSVFYAWSGAVAGNGQVKTVPLSGPGTKTATVSMYLNSRPVVFLSSATCSVIVWPPMGSGSDTGMGSGS